MSWWLRGVGLGAFEAVFRLVQPGTFVPWVDYANNELLQWVLEMGLPMLPERGWIEKPVRALKTD
ncbi:MAG: hypothetical protein RQ729_00705 [Wenzhouxiangellaceae bacterium]|nr:hypothetical protein [Wenzhouxiangellaceae bacterium]